MQRLLHIGVIRSQHWYNNEAFLCKLAKKSPKISFFGEKKMRSFSDRRVSLVTKDGVNILMKAVTCSVVLYLVHNIGNLLKRFQANQGKKETKIFFLRKENTFHNVKRLSLVTKDGINILMQAVTCSTVL